MDELVYCRIVSKAADRHVAPHILIAMLRNFVDINCLNICYTHMNLNYTIFVDFSYVKNIEHQTLVSFLLLTSIYCNLPAASPSAYGVYISQLMRYSRTCGSYQDFLDRGFNAANKEATEPSVPIG